MKKKMVKNKRRRKKGKNYSIIKWLSVGFSLTVLLYGLFFLYKQSLAYHPIPPEILRGYPVKGIDISRHNGVVDWTKIKEQGFVFAFIKATESVAYIDTTFQNNYKQAKKEGLLVGAYHFFRFDEEGNKQANHFIKNSIFQKGDLPPVIDVEHSTFNFLSKPKNVALRLRDLEHRLHAYYGIRPIIYTNKDCYQKYIRDFFPNARLWICDLQGEPSEEQHPNWLFWQYSHQGDVLGVNEKVDLNIFRGSKNQLQELTQY